MVSVAGRDRGSRCAVDDTVLRHTPRTVSRAWRAGLHAPARTVDRAEHGAISRRCPDVDAAGTPGRGVAVGRIAGPRVAGGVGTRVHQGEGVSGAVGSLTVNARMGEIHRANHVGGPTDVASTVASESFEDVVRHERDVQRVQVRRPRSGMTLDGAAQVHDGGVNVAVRAATSQVPDCCSQAPQAEARLLLKDADHVGSYITQPYAIVADRVRAQALRAGVERVTLRGPRANGRRSPSLPASRDHRSQQPYRATC